MCQKVTLLYEFTSAAWTGISYCLLLCHWPCWSKSTYSRPCLLTLRSAVLRVLHNDVTRHTFASWQDADSVAIRRLHSQRFQVIMCARPCSRCTEASLSIDHGGVAAAGIPLTAVRRRISTDNVPVFRCSYRIWYVIHCCRISSGLVFCDSRVFH